jgi:uncharacterized membrane protein
MKSRLEIKYQAKAHFGEQYWVCVQAFALYAVISSVLSGATAGIAALFLMPPLTVGYSFFSLRVYRGETGDIGDALTMGFQNYGKTLVGILWMYLFTFLWSLLLIIPGIIKGIAYSMTPYILAERDDVSAKDALILSMQMTQGHKAEIFVMMLSFIGWWLLTALTFGILAFFYTGPYMSISLAGIYEELKMNTAEQN